MVGQLECAFFCYVQTHGILTFYGRRTVRYSQDFLCTSDLQPWWPLYSMALPLVVGSLCGTAGTFFAQVICDHGGSLLFPPLSAEMALITGYGLRYVDLRHRISMPAFPIVWLIAHIERRVIIRVFALCRSVRNPVIQVWVICGSTSV